MVMILIVAVAAGSYLAGSSAASDPAAPPRVVATSPAAGAVLPPGPFTLSVTFDRPMRDRSYSFVQKSTETYPECAGQPSVSRDGRTFSLRCRAIAGRRYEVWFNSPPYMNFRSADGVAAQPHRLLLRVRD